jgi:class 3 adenylate cyclase
MGVRTDEGEELIGGPNQVFDLPPGHVAWVEGDDELVMVDWAGGAGYEVQPGESARVMATILFTDIVGSTARARKAGDAAGKRTLAMHDDVVRTVLVRFGGREVETAGDSFLIVFDGAERAIRCGLDLVEALAAIDIPIRVGIHSGEVALSPEHVHGVAVHVAARILTKPAPPRFWCPAPRATLPRALLDWRSTLGDDTASKGLEREHDLFAAASAG